ncbi:MAG: acyl-CoA reductase [Bacteroidota bacterium]
MTLEDRITALAALGSHVRNNQEHWASLQAAAFNENQWFTIDNTSKSLRAIADQYLDERRLRSWVANYDIQADHRRRVGLVLAGNIPLVGWHDVLCTFVAGHTAVLKLSSKDRVLITGLIDALQSIDNQSISYFEIHDQLKDFDAVIATGGETAATHFEHYFGRYPNVIRGNRSSVAVLSGDESNEDLELIGQDVFTYFGMGCRSVSKLYVPRGYDFDRFFKAIIPFGSVIEHSKYKNNYDYSNAIYLLGQTPFLTNNFLILMESPDLSSRISCLHYEYYDDQMELDKLLSEQIDEIQCISTTLQLPSVHTVSFGECQRPGLRDYADGIDTMSFLTTQI